MAGPTRSIARSDLLVLKGEEVASNPVTPKDGGKNTIASYDVGVLSGSNAAAGTSLKLGAFCRFVLGRCSGVEGAVNRVGDGERERGGVDVIEEIEARCRCRA